MVENNNEQARVIYLLFRGDSQRDPLVCASTSKVRLRTAVEALLHDGTVTYCDENGAVIPNIDGRIRKFRADWKELSRIELNERIHGLYFGITYNGSII